MKRHFSTTLFFCLSLIACSEQQSINHARVTQTIIAARTSFVTPIFFSGTLQPINQTNVSAPADGVLIEKNFSYGQAISKNTLLVKINSEQLEKDYHDALTSYLTNKDKLATAKSQYEGSKQLFDLGIVSGDRFKADQSAFENANIDFLRSLYSLRAALAKGGGSFEKIKQLDIADTTQIDRALQNKLNVIELVAPVSGVAMQPQKGKDNDNGQLQVGSQIKQGQSVVSIGDLTGVRVEVPVDEVNISKIKVGQKVEITGAAFPTVVLHGEIESVASQAQSAADGGSSLPTFTVKAIVKTLTSDQMKAIRVGMSAQVKLLLSRTNVITLPIATVHENKGKRYVTKQVNGQRQEVVVETGEASSDSVEIISGVNPGDQIVYSTDAQ